MTSAGAVISGEMEGPSPKAVIEQLQGLGHYPISAAATKTRGWRRWLSDQVALRRRASARDLANASHELATLLHAGLPLERALEIVSRLENVRRLQSALSAVLARVRDGTSFSNALAADRDTFPQLYVGLVRAGELGGNLESTLYRLADYFTKTYALREALKSAMVYPAIVMSVAGLAIAIILVFVLPEFEPLFASAGAKLPTSTQLIIAAGDFLGAYWWLLLLGLAAALSGIKSALRRPVLRLRWDSLKLRVPLLGTLATKIEIERFTRTLGTLISDGMPLPTALSLTKDTLANAAVAKAVGETAAALREGAGLAELLSGTRLFPSMALDLIRVGEETGKLEDMLLRQADIYEREIRHTLDRLLALLVPAVTVFLGFVVAGLIASLFTAILSINDLALQ
jgi:general secretion pathway protein F